MIQRVSSLLNIRSGEGRTAGPLVVMMLLSAAGYTLGGTAIEALYFTRYGTQLLPYLYIGLGLVSSITSLSITALLSRVKRQRIYVLVPLAASLALVIAWALLFNPSKIVFPALWLAKEALNSIISLIGWNTASAVCDSRQAKRLFPLFSASRILGSVLGGFGTGALANLVGTQALVLAWAIAMAGVFELSRRLMRDVSPSSSSVTRSRVRRRKTSTFSEMQKGWAYVKQSPLLRWVSLGSILFSILYFSIALPFSHAVTVQFPHEKDLAGFLGLFNGLSTALAFIASIFIANRLYARFGIMNMILALPLIYLIGFASLAAFNVFAVVVAFRFVQMLWLSGIADAAYQTMFSAVPQDKHDQVNAFLSGGPDQIGVLIAGGILIVGQQAFTPRQLYLIGLAAAIANSLVFWRASAAYRYALVSSLREGRPTIFGGRASLHDSTSLDVARENLSSAEPLVRRVAAEMLAEMNSSAALVPALQDADASVRIAALRGLVDYAPALDAVSTLVTDPEPAVRQRAVRTLGQFSANPPTLSGLVAPSLNDIDTHVQLEAALALLKHGAHAAALDKLREACRRGDVFEREHALHALGELGDRESLALIRAQTTADDSNVRRAAAMALGACGDAALADLVAMLADEDSSVRSAAGQALAHAGEAAAPAVLTALHDPLRADGALIALGQLPAQRYARELHEFARGHIESALHYDELAQPLTSDDDRIALLRESLLAHSRTLALQALRALALLNDRESIEVAVENLQSKIPTQLANALETLDGAHDAALIKPMLRIWERQESSQAPATHAVADEHNPIMDLLRDKNDWLRACAFFAAQGFARPAELEQLAKSDTSALVRAIVKEGEPMDTRTTIPIMERIVFLRRVPLLTDLPPADLQRLAALATEHHAEHDEVIFEQGDTGEEMYIIVHGELRVMVGKQEENEKEIARRAAGDVVGEMSIISGEPRNATLIAAVETHLLSLDKRSFEGLLRERPEVSLAIMRVLCVRLKELSK